nr:hypothetical protein [Tanacetum cinerariifolium]
MAQICSWKSTHMFFEECIYVFERVFVCSNKFDEKVKRARMFVEEYTYVLGRVHMYFGRTLPVGFLSNLNELDEIEILVNGMMFRCNVHREEVIGHHGRHVYVLLGNTWDALVANVGLENGSIFVFTKNMGKRLWSDAFDNDESMVTEVFFKVDDRMKHVCFWPDHMDHFGEMPRTFYKRYALIQPQNRLTIPLNFVKFHHMHTFKKALIIHQEYQELMEVRMVPNLEDPSRTNHVNIYGHWRLLLEGCHFSYIKMIRFKYMLDGEDLDVEEGQNKKLPIFHIC